MNTLNGSVPAPVALITEDLSAGAAGTGTGAEGTGAEAVQTVEGL